MIFEVNILFRGLAIFDFWFWKCFEEEEEEMVVWMKLWSWCLSLREERRREGSFDSIYRRGVLVEGGLALGL